MIARRRLIDRLRRTGRRPQTTVLSEGYEPRPERSEPIEAHTEARLAARALESLRPVQREVLLMSAYEGMSHREIADSTGMPLGTVKAHARRGMHRVRELLAA
jgi:RNA polymerase sigma-70 factor (ECF subfamily)